MTEPSGAGPLIAHVAPFGGLLGPRIHARVLAGALRARLPGASVVSVVAPPAPAGQPGEGSLYAGDPGELDPAVVVFTGRLPPDAPAGGKAAWLACAVPAEVAAVPEVASVRDEASAGRVAGGAVPVVADPAVLLHGVVPPHVRARRIAYLRLIRWFPPVDQVLLVEDSVPEGWTPEGAAAGVASLLAAHPGLEVALLATPGPPTGLAAAVEKAAGCSVWQAEAPAWAEDVAACIDASTIVVASTVEVATAAAGAGRPCALLGPGEQGELASWAQMLGAPQISAGSPGDLAGAAAEAAGLLEAAPAPTALQPLVAALESELDRVAALAPPHHQTAAALRLRIAALEDAARAREERHNTERAALGDAVHDLRLSTGRRERELLNALGETSAGLRALEGELAAAATERDALRSEIAAIRRSRTYRYTSLLRDMLGRARRFIR